MLHYIKLCSNDLSIVAEQQGLRNRETHRMQSFLDPKLSVHLQTNSKSEILSGTCTVCLNINIQVVSLYNKLNMNILYIFACCINPKKLICQYSFNIKVICINSFNILCLRFC